MPLILAATGRGDGAVSGEQLGDVDAERVSEWPESADPDVPLASLHETDNGSMQTSLMGELLLTQAASDAELTDAQAERGEVLRVLLAPSGRH